MLIPSLSGGHLKVETGNSGTSPCIPDPGFWTTQANLYAIADRLAANVGAGTVRRQHTDGADQ